jgi:tRNA A-37 threonylcarbamoyl transferase component Bud32
MYTRSQPKAMSLDHFLDKRDIPNESKAELKLKMTGLKTPQLKSCYESLVFGRKPIDGTNLDNYLNYEVGLINNNATTGNGGMFPSNIISSDSIRDDVDRCFLIEKPIKKKKENLILTKLLNRLKYVYNY